MELFMHDWMNLCDPTVFVIQPTDQIITLNFVDLKPELVKCYPSIKCF
jgi:hypothetical protein